MRRRLLDLCLLAYPRASRRRAVTICATWRWSLAERQGLARQAVSLLLGGVRERAGGAGRWSRRIGAASLVGLALAFGALAVSAGAQGSHEVDRFACSEAAAGGGSGCAAQAQAWSLRASGRDGVAGRAVASPDALRADGMHPRLLGARMSFNKLLSAIVAVTVLTGTAAATACSRPLARPAGR